MSVKSKAGCPKKPPANKMTQAEQSELFIKTARELGVDESGSEFERMLNKVSRQKPIAHPAATKGRS